MTVLNTGSSKKFAAGWENVFSGKRSAKKAPAAAAKSSAAKKSPAKKKSGKKQK